MCGQFRPILTEVVKHKEELLVSELKKLMSKAVRYQGEWNNQWLKVQFAYRNKTAVYFENIMYRKKGIMEVYVKDSNGDPGCPINGEIDGLFFAVRLDPETGDIPNVSPFGDTHIIIPIEKLLHANMNLYFADFYCNNTKQLHYVTLVATRLNSVADRFCNKHLPSYLYTTIHFFATSHLQITVNSFVAQNPG